MVSLADLWLPILVGAAVLFIASSIIWMATPLHKHDYKNPGDKEESILSFLKSAALAPGVYYVPWCQGKEKDPAVQEKMKAGPWAMVLVQPGPPNMGKMLGLWFVHLLIVTTIVAYVAANAGLAPGERYLSVFRVVGATALLAHAGYALPLSIWHGLPFKQLTGKVIDGLIYALLTAGVFGWLWPSGPKGIPGL